MTMMTKNMKRILFLEWGLVAVQVQVQATTSQVFAIELFCLFYRQEPASWASSKYHASKKKVRNKLLVCGMIGIWMISNRSYMSLSDPIKGPQFHKPVHNRSETFFFFEAWYFWIFYSRIFFIRHKFTWKNRDLVEKIKRVVCMQSLDGCQARNRKIWLFGQKVDSSFFVNIISNSC